jgi:heme/copper-type cytochrome/quinol oxidase subunit 2
MEFFLPSKANGSRASGSVGRLIPIDLCRIWKSTYRTKVRIDMHRRKDILKTFIVLLLCIVVGVGIAMGYFIYKSADSAGETPKFSSG